MPDDDLSPAETPAQTEALSGVWGRGTYLLLKGLSLATLVVLALFVRAGVSPEIRWLVTGCGTILLIMNIAPLALVRALGAAVTSAMAGMIGFIGLFPGAYRTLWGLRLPAATATALAVGLLGGSVILFLIARQEPRRMDWGELTAMMDVIRKAGR